MTDDSSHKVLLRQRIKTLLDRDSTAEPAISTAEAQDLVRELDFQLLDLDTRDAAERRRLTERLLRLGQLYTTLSKISQAVIRLRDRRELFAEVCRIAVVDGGFCMVWIGWVNESSGAVEPLAWAGDKTGYVSRAMVTVRNEGRGRGPTGTALREDRFIFVNSVRSDPIMAPWREPALACGYESVASLPLHRGGRTVAAMNFYSSEPGFFDPERVRLLEEVGPSLSFALDKMQAEAEVESLSQQRQLALDAARLGWLHYDPIRQSASWDSRCKEIFGAAPDQPLDDKILSFFHPDDLPRALADFETSLNPGRPQSYRAEYRLQRSDGSRRWIAVHGLSAFEGEGAVRRASSFIGAIADITERKQSEQALRDSEEKYRQLFATETDALVLFEAQTGKMIDVNESAQRLYGYTRKEFLDLTCWDMTVEPEETQKSNDRLLAQGFDQVSRRYHRKKDGTVFPMEFSAVSFKLGEQTVFSVAVRDISERLRAEQELRDSEEKYHRLFDTESDAILLLDAHSGAVLDANESALRLYGYSRAEIMTKASWDFTTVPDETRLNHAKLLAGGTEFVPLRYHNRKDGSTVPVEISASGFRLGDRQVICGVMRNVTERVRADQEADEYRKRLQALSMELALAEERERKDLAAALHDDLVQILALIKIRLDLFGQLDQEAQRREGLGEVRRLVDLANTSARSIMLHLSHPILYERGLVPAVEWLAEDMHQLHHLAITIQTSPGIDPLDLKTRVVLFRCLRELLVNVAKHAGADQASVELVRTDDTVRATVADRGSGFAAETANVRTDSGGFGLFAIKERLTMLRGRMTIDSTLGQGTTVTLEVPVAGPESETPSAVIHQS